MNSLKKLVVSLEPLYPSKSCENDVNSQDNEKGETHSRYSGPYPVSTPCEPISEEAENEECLSSESSVWDTINSLLYTICIRPILLMATVATFPFTYMFGSEYREVGASQIAVSSEDINEKTALLKEEKIMANSIKSPSASKYILPPPPRLFPLSRNPEKRRKKRCWCWI